MVASFQSVNLMRLVYRMSARTMMTVQWGATAAAGYVKVSILRTILLTLIIFLNRCVINIYHHDNRPNRICLDFLFHITAVFMFCSVTIF